VGIELRSAIFLLVLALLGGARVAEAADSEEVDVVAIILHKEVPATVKIGFEQKVKDADGNVHIVRGDNFKGGGPAYAALEAPSGEKIKTTGDIKLSGDKDKVKLDSKVEKGPDGRKYARILILKKDEKEEEEVSIHPDDCTGVFGITGDEVPLNWTACEPIDIDCLQLSCGGED
jgi:hypothetical protein